jgi:uncharacterized Zn finger protein
MSYYYRGWAPYVSVAQRRRKSETEIKKLRTKGSVISPVKIDGLKIAKTFWGKAWCDNLKSYRDYENRLQRGRSYLRNGSVLDLQIAPREVTGLVSGSELYKVKVSLGEVAKTHWENLCADCAGEINSLVELLRGRFPKAVMERICRQASGLFPHPSEIRFTCSCPDHASMCKHVAAVLYGVGARLDESPQLLFRLRAVDETELLSNLGNALPTTPTPGDTTHLLEDTDLAALFDLDMAEVEKPVPLSTRDIKPSAAQKTTRKSAVAKPPRTRILNVKANANTVKPADTAKPAAATVKASAKATKPIKKAPIKPTRRQSTKDLTKAKGVKPTREKRNY